MNIIESTKKLQHKKYSLRKDLALLSEVKLRIIKEEMPARLVGLKVL